MFDDAHGFSQRANAFVDRRGGRIATCLLVENGVIRVLGSPNCSRRGALSIQQVRDRLRSACAALDHMFWPDDVSLRDKAWFNFGRLQGHNQVADRVLLGLAVRHRGCLATFDQAIGRQSVHGAATRHLLL